MILFFLSVLFFFFSQKEHTSKAEAAKEKLNGLLKRLFDSSWWTDCVEKGWRWVKDDVSAVKTERMGRFQKIWSILPSCHFWIGSVNTYLKIYRTMWCTSPLDRDNLSFIRLFVKGTDPLLCSMHIQFPAPFSPKLAAGWTHTHRKSPFGCAFVNTV